VVGKIAANKRVKKGGSIGYYIGGNFVSLVQLRTQLEKINEVECPF